MMKEIVDAHNAPLPGEYRQILEEEEPLDLRHYWYVIYRHRWAAMMFLFSALTLSAASVPWGHSVYTASTTLYIQSQTRGILDSADLLASGINQQETQQKLLSSRSLIAEVIRNLDLGNNPSFHQVPRSALSVAMTELHKLIGLLKKWLVTMGIYVGVLSDNKQITAKRDEFELGVAPWHIDRYLQALSVSPVPDSYLVQLQFTSADPSLSKTVINRHAATFISRNLATRFELTAETKQFLESKLVELKAKVEASERGLNQFQRDHKIVSIDKGSNLLLDQLKKLNTDLTEARSKRIELESLHRLVSVRDNQLLSQVVNNPFVQQLRNQINNVDAQIAQLSTKFKPTYRGLIALQQEKDEAKSRLDQEIARIVQTIERDYRAARENEGALAAEAEKARQVALNLQEKAVEYAVLDREVASNRALYEAVFKKTQEAALTGGEPMPAIRIIDRAEIPMGPDGNRASRFLLISLAAGLFGGVGLAFLLHVLDKTLRTPEEVARFLRLPTLGIVPDVVRLANIPGQLLESGRNRIPAKPGTNGRALESRQLVTYHHPLSLMAEMYRSICTAILFSHAVKPPQTILITSSQAEEGKTVTAINISTMLAQSRGPVLLIDADLHGGQCHKLLDVKNGAGLSNVLTGNGNVSQFIKKTNVRNLSILGRGQLPPNPADLLGSEIMSRTLAELARDFRFIIIDSAPLLPVSDSVLLAAQVDGVVLVAGGQNVSRDSVRKARDRLEYVNAKILGVVMNRVDVSSAEYAEYRNVYQSHYSRYGDGLEEFWNAGSTSAKLVNDVVTATCKEIVPPELFDHIATVLTEFAGPMASVIFRDQIVALGGSPDAFPVSRLEELIEAVSGEIASETRRIAFRNQVSEEIRSFMTDGSFNQPSSRSDSA